MLILGLDLALNCGWCLFRDGAVESCGLFRVPSPFEDTQSEVRWRRELVRLERWSKWLVDLRPHLSECGAIAYEHPGSYAGMRGAHAEIFGGLRAVLTLELGDVAPMSTIHPSTMKKEIAGSGKASKAAVREAVNSAFDLDLHADDEDVSDAVGVAWTYHKQRLAA